MVSEAQKKAIAKYRKNNVKNVTITFYPGQRYMYDWITKKAEDNGISRIKVVRGIIERAYSEREIG